MLFPADVSIGECCARSWKGPAAGFGFDGFDGLWRASRERVGAVGNGGDGGG
ncbi:MAG: hypothetical protein JO340_17760 [Acidobacteriaceae bacterium]|nr:hypothetical protein [Acidobacteriaceae bacterium]